jgi:hypothetical protein
LPFLKKIILQFKIININKLINLFYPLQWGTRCKESWSPEFQQKYQLIQTVALFITPLLVISALCLHMNIVLRQKALQVSKKEMIAHFLASS